MELRPDGTPAHPWGHSAHPDLLLVGHEINQKPANRATELVIEQVRAISEKLGLTAQLGGAQIVIVDPVEAINWNAFNALLKTLEEPQPGRYLWLLCADPALAGHHPQPMPTPRSCACRHATGAGLAARPRAYAGVGRRALDAARGDPGWPMPGSRAMGWRCGAVAADAQACSAARRPPSDWLRVGWPTDAPPERLQHLADLALREASGLTDPVRTAGWPRDSTPPIGHVGCCAPRCAPTSPSPRGLVAWSN